MSRIAPDDRVFLAGVTLGLLFGLSLAIQHYD